MSFWQNLLLAKPYKDEKLLDIAIIVSTLPLLFVLSSWIILFFTVTSLLLFRKRQSKGTIFLVMLIGFSVIAVDFSSQYELAHLKRITVFTTLVSTVLILAILLQKLSGESNIYIKLSPLMFFTLSFFFFKSFNMLIFAVLALSVFVVLRLWSQMQSTLLEAIKTSTILLLMALPTIILLFIFFPRITFEKATFGFTQQELKRLGHDGTMNMDSKALDVISKRVVMEVRFKDKVLEGELYFRGSTLYEDQTERWKPLFINPTMKASDVKSDDTNSYTITLYPTEKKYLYSLDRPQEFDKKISLHIDATLQSHNKVTKRLTYHVSSVPEPKSTLYAKELEAALQSQASRDDITFATIRTIIDKKMTPIERFKAIETWGFNQKLTYTTAPKAIDTSDPVDDFLFGTKEGYCVHFAASFTNMFRLAGIPSRVVTGYLANRKNIVNDFLIIREEDAHAWVEVYLDGRWSRVESTSFAYSSTTQQSFDVAKESKEIGMTWWEIPSVYLLYVKNSIDQWILQYNHSSQKKFVQTLMSDVWSVAKFVFILVLIIGFIIFAIKRLFQRSITNPALKVMQPLLKELAKKGDIKLPTQSMENFLMQREEKSLCVISQLYSECVYGNGTLMKLGDAVKVWLANSK
jgi:protein-glutamine gamma-glutamyltransferase